MGFLSGEAHDALYLQSHVGALEVELPMLMMHCICNLILGPGRWNFPCLRLSVYAHDALYLQSHSAALEVELPCLGLSVYVHDALCPQSPEGGTSHA